MQLITIFHKILVAAWLLPILGMSSPREPRAALIPDALPLSTPSNAQIFVQSDTKGNLFILRSDTLDVYRVHQGQIGQAQRLHLPTPTDSRFSSASMNANGDSWALVESNQILHFKNGRVQRTPDPGWMVTSVAIVGDTPAAAVLPISIGRPKSAGRPTSPPLILNLSTNGWTPWVSGTFPRRTKDRDPVNTLFAEHTTKLAPGSRGKIWAVNPHSGRVVRYTPNGRSDLIIVFGTGSPKYKGDEEQLSKQLASRLQKNGHKNDRAQIGVLTAETTIRGFTEASDGTFYVLLNERVAGSVLARYNAILNLVEWTPVRISGDGELRMAAGRDGLAWTVAGGSELWQLGWQVLEAADWTELEDVRLLSGTSPPDAGVAH